MIDKKFVEQKLKLLRQDLDELNQEYEVYGEELETDTRSQHVVEHLLEHIINRAIDINGHLLVESNQAPPETYEESFVDLATIKALPKNFADKIAKSAGLRNRLIHEYDDIDFDILKQSIDSALKQYPSYIDHIIKYLEKK